MPNADRESGPAPRKTGADSMGLNLGAPANPTALEHFRNLAELDF
jgi:hypothetical protein